MKEMFKMLNKEMFEEIKKDKKEIEKSVSNLLDDAMCFVAVNNNGVIVEGDMPSVMSCISALVSALNKNSGISKEDIMEAVELGLKSKEELRQQSKNSLEELLKKLSELVD